LTDSWSAELPSRLFKHNSPVGLNMRSGRVIGSVELFQLEIFSFYDTIIICDSPATCLLYVVFCCMYHVTRIQPMYVIMGFFFVTTLALNETYS